MKKLFFSLASICCLCSAFAGNSQNSDSEVQVIRFEDLKVACENPAMFHNQVAPSNIQISCSEAKLKWMPEVSGSQMLNTNRMIVTSVISNKYTVSPMTSEVPSEPQTAPCTQYKQISETVESVVNTTCEQILAYQGTGDEYCLAKMDALRIASPEAIKVQDTGRLVSFCEMKRHQKGSVGNQDK